MNQVFSTEEIELMDKIFQLKFNNSKSQTYNEDSKYSRDLQLDLETFNYLHSELCVISVDLGLIRTKNVTDGTFIIRDFNIKKTDKFISNNGFKGYFFKQKIADILLLVKSYVPILISIIAILFSFFKTNSISTEQLKELELKTEEKINIYYSVQVELLNDYKDRLSDLENKLIYLSDSLNTLSLDTVKIDTIKK